MTYFRVFGLAHSLRSASATKLLGVLVGGIFVHIICLSFFSPFSIFSFSPLIAIFPFTCKIAIRYSSQDGGKGQRGTVIDVTDCGSHKNACVHVKWDSSGNINSYRWGVDENDGQGLQYDVISENINSETGLITFHSSSVTPNLFFRFSFVPLFLILTYIHKTLTNTGKSVIPDVTTPLLYTPGEVKSSLVEDIGELTKRGVLRYMKQLSTQTWQAQHKLNWSENTLVHKLSGKLSLSIYIRISLFLSLASHTNAHTSYFRRSNIRTLQQFL